MFGQPLPSLFSDVCVECPGFGMIRKGENSSGKCAGFEIGVYQKGCDAEMLPYAVGVIYTKVLFEIFELRGIVPEHVVALFQGGG